MTSIAADVFLLLHAGVTAAIWIPPQRGKEIRGWGWQASWLFADSRSTMVTLGALASAALGIASVGVLADQGWWAGAAIVGAVVSLALIAATFTPWWSAAVVINLVVVWLAWTSMTTQVSGP